MNNKRFVFVQPLSRAWFFATPWTAAHQASLSLTIIRGEGTNIPYRRISINKCRRNEGIKISQSECHSNCCGQDPLMNAKISDWNLKQFLKIEYLHNLQVLLTLLLFTVVTLVYTCKWWLHLQRWVFISLPPESELDLVTLSSNSIYKGKLMISSSEPGRHPF